MLRVGTVEWNGGTAVAVSRDEGNAAERAGILAGYADVEALIASQDAWRADVDAALEASVSVADLVWRPPVLRPGKVLGVALNNSANPDRIMRGPDTPAMFVKPSSSLVGHGCPVVMRERYGRVHPEPEMVVVIGLGGSEIPVDRALEHVFGYTIMNDLTSPTMREADTFHYRAIHPDPEAEDGIRYVDSWVSYPARYKGSDTFGPTGPWVTLAEDIPDPHALRITCTHDGRLVTEDSTENLRYSVAEVVSFASEYLTLEAGDIIAMGTALKRSAKGGAVQNVDLAQLGGVIEVSIERIGTLSNPVEHR